LCFCPLVRRFSASHSTSNCPLMKPLWDWIKNGYLRIVDPVADFFVRAGVHPNTITAFGTACTIAASVIFGMGHIKTAGWFLGLTALFDVMDGTVARRSGK